MLLKGLIGEIEADGIGFRNHIMPLDAGDGSEWTEGLLYIQPETVCVSLKT